MGSIRADPQNHSRSNCRTGCRTFPQQKYGKARVCNQQSIHSYCLHCDGAWFVPTIRVERVHVPRNVPILPSAIRFHVGSHRQARSKPHQHLDPCIVPHQRTDRWIRIHACRRCGECSHSARNYRFEWRWLRWRRLEDLFRLCIPSWLAKRTLRYGAWSSYRCDLHMRIQQNQEP